MATYIDCKNLRTSRQKENNELMFRALISGDELLVKHLCNNNELSRVLEELSFCSCTLQQLLYKCKVDHIYSKTLAGRISKNASRQSTKDEAYILDKCNETLSRVGIQVENLNVKAFRPTRDGRILSNIQFRKSGLKKSDCLKSFDARITGNVNGWVFAKVAYGSGGHQDNVFAEAHEFGEWVREHGNPNELFVILIDTDLTSQFKELREKFWGRVLVVNHFDFQCLLMFQLEAIKRLFLCK